MAKFKKLLNNGFLIVIYVVFFAILFLLGYFLISHFNQSYLNQYKGRNVFDFINSEWRFLYQILMMIILSLTIVMAVGLLSILNALTGRWKPIRVLIIFEHKHKDLVNILENSLKTQNIKPFFVPFEPIEHDALIEKVTRSIKKCNAVIVLPGLEKSFVDAEILTASALEKPIIYLKISVDQKTPDTSYIGYPIFDLEKLKEANMGPLQRFLLYITRSPKELLKNFYRATSTFYEKKGITVVIGIFACDTLCILLMPLVSFFVNLEWQEKVRYIIFWGLTLVTVTIFGLIYIKTVIARIRAMRITRQKTRTGSLTYQLLEKGFDSIDSDREILYCILHDPLPTKE